MLPVSRDELLGWTRLHGAVLRTEPPLQDGDQFDKEAFAALQRELGSE